MDMTYDIFLMFNPGRMIPHETEEEHFDFAAATGHFFYMPQKMDKINGSIRLVFRKWMVQITPW